LFLRLEENGMLGCTIRKTRGTTNEYPNASNRDRTGNSEISRR
jgi:hypothetical protein